MAEGHGKSILVEAIVIVILLFFVILSRPLVVGKVVDAGTPYNITSTNTATGVTTQQTVTPAGAMTSAQADSFYTILIFVIVIVGLAVMVFTAMGKLHF